ncbi:MAG TPA: 4-hydroxythreonine-4-phosphate dehydrogenase PdxA, partial [Chromatiales bacterium]|nr:4-hydroxythreonine-4-phosphate dehydrogenase PdxA [Chromatiales bacterium]
MTSSIPRIALTPGEPAGIGPDLIIMAAQREWPAQLVAIADPQLLTARAGMLKLPLALEPWTKSDPARPAEAGQLFICEQPLAVAATPGQPDPANATALLGALDCACDGCMNGLFDAMVTGPMHKGVINDA